MAGTKAAGNKTTGKGKKTSGTKAAGTKVSGSRTAGTRAKKQTQNQNQEEGFLRSEVFIIGSFALAVLFFLSNFHLCGAAGDYLRMVQLGIFGMIGFVAPVILFVGTCFALANRGNPIAVLKLVSVIVAVIILCGLAEMFFGEGFKEGQKAVEAFFRSSENGAGGGFIGGLLVVVLGSAFGTVGTYLVLFVLLAICGVCITERSLVSLVKKGGGKAYQYAREDVERKRVIHEERKEERKRLREEQKLRGVNLSSTKLDAWVDEPEADVYDDYPEYEGQDGYEEYGADDRYEEYGAYEEYEAYEEPQKAAGRRQDMQADGGTEQIVSPADLFTGTIHMPKSYEEPEDKVPFEAGRAVDVSGMGNVSCESPGRNNSQELHVQKDTRTLGEMEITDDYCVPWNARGEKTADGAGKYGDLQQTSEFDGWAGRFHEEDPGEGSFYGEDAAQNRNREDFHDGKSAYDGPGNNRFYDGNNGRYDESALYGDYGNGDGDDRGAGCDVYGNNDGCSGNAGYDAYRNGDGYGRGTGYDAHGNNDGYGRGAAYDAHGNNDSYSEGAMNESCGDDEGYGEDALYDAYGNDGRYSGGAIDKSHGDQEGYGEPALYDTYGDDGRYSEGAMNEGRGNDEGYGEPAIHKAQENIGFYDTQSSGPSVSSAGEFSVPEESRRVVTATGKIIESDTEALKKKVEKRREEAIEAGDVIVPSQMQEEMAVQKPYEFPPIDLLKRGKGSAISSSDKEYRETAIKLQQTLRNFGVGVTVTNVSCGPSVTRYELHPEQGVKVSKIVGLADDIKLNLAAADIRIEAPIPGKSAVGIEVPNKENTVVYLRELLESEEFKNHKSKLAFAVGKDIGGQVVVTDVAKMPHLLIAGATGSGKSVCINTLIMSLIYKADPNDVKMIMIDPKVVELSAYNGIPHLLIPVVTDPKKASGALNWAVAEMMDRYQKFAQYNVRNLQGYNAKVEAIKDIEDENKPQKMPLIVIIVDELADLMMVSPGEVEDAICRLAQLARAAGIHLVIATQRPSVNVITGLIKANVPSRIAFSVSSGVDSRTIIDMYGAEKLLGKGDMLFYPAGYQKPQRVQGAFVSDQEVSGVVEFLTAQNTAPVYRKEIESQIAMPVFTGQAEAKGDGRDEYFAQAGKFIIEKEKGSIGMLQRMFKIGFNRAARIMDQLAEAGVVGEEEGTKPRKVLMTLEEFQDMLNQ